MCRLCHTTFNPVTVGHKLDKALRCTSCHGTDVVPLPKNHQDRTEEQCKLCHTEFAPVPAIAHLAKGHETCTNCHTDKVAPLPASHKGETPRGVKTCQLCHTKELTPPAAPHPLDDKLRETCTPCHNSKVLKALPESHRGPTPRTDAVCKMCHETVTMPPALPHKLEGRQKCDMCHKYPSK